MSTITKERLTKILIETTALIKERSSRTGDSSGVSTEVNAELFAEVTRIALASLETEPVSFDDLRDAVAEMSGGPAMQWSDIYKGHQVVPFINFNSLSRIVEKFRTAPPASVVPDEQHSERFNWTYGQWAEHLGGRHQNNDPANYYEFGSFMAVAEMLRQFGNVQRKAGWNAFRAAMLQGADGIAECQVSIEPSIKPSSRDADNEE